MHTRTHTHTYVRTYVRTYIHTYIHTYEYIHTYIHTFHTYIHFTHTYIHRRCFKKIFTMVSQMLLHGECYVNFYTKGVKTIHRSRYTTNIIDAHIDIDPSVHASGSRSHCDRQNAYHNHPNYLELRTIQEATNCVGT
jgi:hypothetical protein